MQVDIKKVEEITATKERRSGTKLLNIVLRDTKIYAKMRRIGSCRMIKDYRNFPIRISVLAMFTAVKGMQQLITSIEHHLRNEMFHLSD